MKYKLNYISVFFLHLFPATIISIIALFVLGQIVNAVLPKELYFSISLVLGPIVEALLPRELYFSWFKGPLELIIFFLVFSIWMLRAFLQERQRIKKLEILKLESESRLREEEDRITKEKEEEYRIKKLEILKLESERRLREEEDRITKEKEDGITKEKEEEEKRKRLLISGRVKKFGFFDQGTWSEDDKIKTLLEIGADRRLFSKKDSSTEIIEQKLTSHSKETRLLRSISTFNDNLPLFPIIHFWLNINSIEWLETKAKDGKDFPYRKDVKSIVKEAMPHFEKSLSEAMQIEIEAAKRRMGSNVFTWDVDDFNNMGLRRAGQSKFILFSNVAEKLNDFLFHSDELDNLCYFKEQNISVSFDTFTHFGKDLHMKFNRIDDASQ